MRRAFRVVSALGAGAALVWGLAKSLRRRGKSDDEKTPEWPPKPEQSVPVSPVEPVPVKPTKPVVAAAAPVVQPVAVEQAPVEPAEPLVLKGVVVEDPVRLVAFVNDSDEATLQEAGLKGKALSLVLENRPFADARSFGETPGIGRRTLQTACNALD